MEDPEVGRSDDQAASAVPGSINSLYRPLDRHRQEIRVVVLQPAADLEAPLVACLRSVYPKDSPTPKFEALSYVWGEPIFKHPIQLNGCDKFITKNLFQGLRRLREKDQERVLWIDALGINQDDVQEKQHQIPLMKEIYSLASCVIAWLGEFDSLFTEVNMDRLNAFVEALEPFTVPCKFPWKVEIGNCEDFALLADGMTYNVLGFLQNSYWHRVWIVQECVLPARPPVFLYGNRTVRSSVLDLPGAIFSIAGKTGTLWHVLPRPDDLASTPDWISGRMKLGGHLPYLANIRGLYHAQGMGDLPTKSERTDFLSILLSLSTNSECHYPADRVYAVYGLLSNQALYPAPDYSKHEYEIYWEAVASALRSDTQFDWSLWSSPHPLPPDSSFPTWVPDLEKTSDRLLSIFPKSENEDQVSGDIKDERALLTDDRHLRLRGVPVGLIHEVLHIPHTSLPEELALPIYKFLIEYVLTRVNVDLSPKTMIGKVASILRQTVTIEEAMVWMAATPFFDQINVNLREMSLGCEYSQHLLDMTESICENRRFRFEPEDFLEKLDAQLELEKPVTLFITDAGLLGQSLNGCKVGDVVTILGGPSFPWILRPVNRDREIDSPELFHFISTGSVAGAMKGEFVEAVNKLGFRENMERDFILC